MTIGFVSEDIKNKTFVMDPKAVGATPVANVYFAFEFLARAQSGLLTDEELLQAAVDSKSFYFWQDPGEDIYTLDDGEPV
jgi:hypothetical protein